MLILVQLRVLMWLLHIHQAPLAVKLVPTCSANVTWVKMIQ